MGIVAFAFGTPETILPNKVIAGFTSYKAREFNCRVYTQRDICVERGVEAEYVRQEERDKPPPTLRIARGAIIWAKRYRITKILVVAANPHLWRALRDLKKVILEAGLQIEVQACSELNERYPDDFWFCPDSTQERVRTREAWNKRERIIKMLPFFLYEVIAS